MEDFNMKKDYSKLWEHIAKCNEFEIQMSFDDISKILGFSVDHSFLNHKKELYKFGYKVFKISLKEQNVIFRKRNIAYCGLDCFSCEAYIATINDDDKMREKVAKKWSKLNKANITKEMINCEGCKNNGKKTLFCDSLCVIHKCALENKKAVCSKCSYFDYCEKIKPIITNNKEAQTNLKEEKDYNIK